MKNRLQLNADEYAILHRTWRKDCNQTPLTAKLDQMKVGDTFPITGDGGEVQLMRVNVSAWGRRHKKKFSITRQGDIHVCERVSIPKMKEKRA